MGEGKRCPQRGAAERAGGVGRRGKPVGLFLGLLATLWVSWRLLTKPSRAAYPCMQVAAPLASGFVGYLAGLGLFALGLSGLRRALVHPFSLGALLAGLACLAVGLGVGLDRGATDALASAPKGVYAPSHPLGQGKGIHPGRVAWVHDPRATGYQGSGNWWDEGNNDQGAIDDMVAASIRQVTGREGEAQAWAALFASFNTRRGKEGQGYGPGEKIAIKINQNNTGSHTPNNEINASPQLVLALVRSLVKRAGVPEEAITVFDASRFVTDNIYHRCKKEFPRLNFVDSAGGDGRQKAAFAENKIPYSVPSRLAKGLATCALSADYLIDLALLKGHVGQGVTLCAKNFYGVTSISPDWQQNSHDNFNHDLSGKPRYLAFVDFLCHQDLGGKTLLFLIDGLYAHKAVNGAPDTRWKMAPFLSDWPSSLFASEDGVAVDSVARDFLTAEFPNLPDVANCDAYLHEAALAENPPSKTIYDPEKDGRPCPSLGVHDHWNNPADKRYARNLGADRGIELVYLGPAAEATAVRAPLAPSASADPLPLNDPGPTPGAPDEPDSTGCSQSGPDPARPGGDLALWTLLSCSFCGWIRSRSGVSRRSRGGGSPTCPGWTGAPGT